MAYEFTKLSEVYDTATVSDECNVIIEDGGEIKKTAKSNIGKEQVQADWNQTDPTQPDYIKNKLSCDVPYQQLVTDGEGSVKWEDRLAYDDSRVVVDYGDGELLAKVSDEVPSWVSVIRSIKVWYDDGAIGDAETLVDFGDGNFGRDGVFFITTDNYEHNSLVFPEKGVYSLFVPDGTYITGIASAGSDTPEITWDGNIGVIKKLDKKFIPSELNEVILPSSTSGSTKKFKITVDDSGVLSTTDDQGKSVSINSLIDAKLGVIENGSY